MALQVRGKTCIFDFGWTVPLTNLVNLRILINVEAVDVILAAFGFDKVPHYFSLTNCLHCPSKFFTTGKDRIIFVTKEDHAAPSSAELVEEDPNDPYEERGEERKL